MTLSRNIQTLKTEIDTIINDFSANPGKFDNNEWRCYEACKVSIREAEKRKLIPYEHDLYRELIDYITEKLNI